MIIQSVQQTYVFNQTQGAVTEPVNGNWLQAYCEYLGITEPVNASWLQALCNHFGITEPLYASWTIALANYYSITQPLNGSWWYALSQDPGIPPVAPAFVWSEDTRNWEAETRAWDYVTPVAPTAEFTSDVTTVFETGQVQYADTSTGMPTSWLWTFEGGTPLTSTDQNPLVTYDTVGNFDVSLTVTNAEGSNTKTVLQYMTVTVVPVVADFSADNTTPTEGDNVIFTDLSTGTPTEWSWSFAGGNPLTSVVQNPTVEYTTPGTYTVALTASKTGSTDTETKVDYITVDAVSTDVTLTLDMYDSYGDGWNWGWFQLERETAPGVWEAIEYNENPFAFSTFEQYENYLLNGDMTGAKYYKTDDVTNPSSGIYGLTYVTYEPGVTGIGGAPPTSGNTWKEAIGLRSWTVPGTGNYRTVVGKLGSYPSERTYEIFNGATSVAYKTGSADWSVGDIQTTFTL